MLMLVLSIIIIGVIFVTRATASEKLMIPLGKSVAIPANGVKKILAVKEGVVQVLNVSDSEIIISGTGDKPDTTQLILWDMSGRRIYNVETYSEADIIHKKFAAIIGNPNIKLILFPDSAYLKGQAQSKNEEIRAVKVAKSLVGSLKLVNLIEQAVSSPSLQKRIEMAINIPTVKVSVLSSDPNFEQKISPSKTSSTSSTGSFEDKVQASTKSASTSDSSGDSASSQNTSGTKSSYRVLLEGSVKNQNDYIHLSEVVRGFVDDDSQISNLVVIDKPIQVVFQAYILQVDKNNTKDLGIEWGKSAGDGGLTQGVLGFLENSSNAFRGDTKSVGAPVPSHLNPFEVNNINRFDLIAAQVKAWETNGKTKVLANPKLIVYANASPIKVAKAGWTDEKAETDQESNIETDSGLAFVNVGRTIYYPARIDTSGNPTYEHVDASLKLLIRDMYVKNDELKFTVFAKQAEPSFTRGTNAPPDILTRSLMTTVKIKNNETIVLGGLINKSNAVSWKGVPVLSNIPFVGRLFKTRSVNRSRNELVIILTPQIVRDDKDLSGDKKFKTVPIPARSDKLEKLHKMFQQIKSSHLPITK